MPIYLAETDRDVVIQRISGNDQIKKHLENMGLVVGESIRVVNKVNENLIVKVKGVSIAVSHELAKRILI